jgi:hypothetical protein
MENPEDRESSMADLITTLAVLRPTQQWTTMFKHEPYAPALWALLFSPNETLSASDHFGDEWPRVSAETVIADHVIGYRTTVGQARERLMKRLEPVRHLAEAWRVFSLARALSLALAPVPADWLLRLDASTVTLNQGSRYADLMAAAVLAAAELGTRRPTDDRQALRALLSMAHGMNPQTALAAPIDDFEGSGSPLPWPKDGLAVSRALIGIPYEVPTSHVETMTRARHQWEASW